DIGSILGRTFDTLGREWSLFVVLAAPAALGAFVQSQIAPSTTMSASAEPRLDDLVSFVAGTIVGTLFSLLSVLAVTAAVDELWQGRAAGVGDAFARGIRALPRYLGVAILFGLVIFVLVAIPVALILAAPATASGGLVVLFGLGALVLLPVALWVGARLTLLVPVIVLDPAGVTGSIRRAWELSRGHALMLFALSIAIGLIGALPLWGASLFAAFVPNAIIGGIALAISTLVYQPLSLIAITIAWGDRIGGRHADSEAMARGRGRGTGALLVFGLSAILFVIGAGVAAQY
ncbi:MAG: hypothetical protein A2V85_06000, partial [Chloroflexi bacterium RBG_16_72_14]